MASSAFHYSVLVLQDSLINKQQYVFVKSMNKWIVYHGAGILWVGADGGVCAGQRSVSGVLITLHLSVLSHSLSLRPELTDFTGLWPRSPRDPPLPLPVILQPQSWDTRCTQLFTWSWGSNLKPSIYLYNKHSIYQLSQTPSSVFIVFIDVIHIQSKEHFWIHLEETAWEKKDVLMRLNHYQSMKIA